MIHKEAVAFFNGEADSRNLWRKRNWYYHRELYNFFSFSIPRGSSTLEIGCATGELIAEVAGENGYGVDLSPRMLEIAGKNHPSTMFEVGDIEDLRLQKTFDYIIMQDLLGHLGDIWLAFNNLKKLSTPKTRVIITTYNHLWEPLVKFSEKIGLKGPEPYHNWLTLGDIENLLYLNNFEVVKKGRRFLLPFHIPLLSDLINKYVAKIPGIRNLCLIQFIIARPFPEQKEPRQYSVSVVVPCRNEAGNIERLFNELPRLGSGTELVFVDGNSTDGTVEKIKEETAKHPEIPVKLLLQGGAFGKADAVRKGFEASTGEMLMILDADLTVLPEDLKKFYAAIAEGKGEFINGSRLVYPMEKGAMRFLNMLGNKTFSLIFTWTLGQRIKDTLCGTKVLLRSDYEKIKAGRSYFGDFDPFGDFDLLFGASKLNLKITELPVSYKERKYGETKISRFRHGLLLFRMAFIAFVKLKLH